jgi:hypothetical protein
MSYYKNKEKLDPAVADERDKTGPKNINAVFFDTDQRDKKYGEGSESPGKDPSIPKAYDGTKNSGGSHSSTEKPQQ